MPTNRKSRANSRRPTAHRARAPTKRRAKPRGFVGRDASPVLDHYPPKDPSLTLPALARPTPSPPRASPPPAPPTPAPPAPTPATSPPPADAAATPRPIGLIALERPFDTDEFAGLLGQTSIRVNVPRENLEEVLRRISDFMGFGIYVYSIRIRPGPEELLKRFVVELERVDFSPAKKDWVPFEEKGRSDSPFGPTGDRH